jgi:glyoxylase-like metal-dependent hydrolase (beta-lactamase superfamily II)
MSIHYLNCLTIRPYLPRVIGGVTCLLVETNQGPVLVDTGVGVRDYRSKGLMRVFLKALRSKYDLNETALYQVRRLDYQSEDVRHVIITHMHLDHAGGLPDFPRAQVHIYRPEYDHIMSKPGWEFHRPHWVHGPDWVVHELAHEKWYDFDAMRLAGFEPEIWMVPLTGHTPGLSGVAVRKKGGWIFYGSDAVPFDMKVDEVPDWISKLIIGPHVPRIREFMKAHPEVQVVGAHMNLEFYEKSSGRD